MSLNRRIGQEARRLDPVRTLATVAVSPFYGFGWIVGFLARLLWIIVSWLCSAIKIGIMDGLKRQ